nr:MoxR family ATPase [Caulobacter sp. SLTY]
MFKQTLPYPSAEEEKAIVARFGARTGQPDPTALGVETVVSVEDLAGIADLLASVRLTDEIGGYVVSIARATRESADFETGVSPRCAAMLAAAGRARAVLNGRDYVIPDDIKALALPALRHRVILSPAAEIEGRKVDDALTALITQIEAPR